MVAPTATAPISQACLTVPNIIWSYCIGIAQKFIVIDFDNKRNFVRILAGYGAKTPKVEATALQPPSMASLTIFSPSK